MKRKIRSLSEKISVALFLLLCFACHKQINYNHLDTITGYDNDVLANGEGINIASFRIIPLELTDESILGVINKVEAIDSFFVVHSGNDLFCFNLQGQYQWHYGESGRGSQEYMRLNTFYIDRQKKTVNLIDEFLGKILTYNLQGEFLSEKAYDNKLFYMLHNASLIEGHSLLCEHYVYGNFNTIYSLVNLDTETQTPLFKSGIQSEGVAMPIGQTPFSLHPGCKLLVPFDNKIYTYDSLHLKPVQIIETKRKLVSPKQLETVKDFSIITYFDTEQRGDFVGFKDICETNDYLLLNEAGANQYFLIDKTEKSGSRYSYGVEEESRFLPLINIFAAWQNNFIGKASAFELQDIVAKIPEDTGNQYLQALRAAGKAIEADANPCLLLYTLKKQPAK